MRSACSVLLSLCLIVPAFASGGLSNRRAPGFSLSDSSMTQHDPQDLRGKVVIVDFMKTDCPNCRKVGGILEQIKTKYAGKVAVLSVVTLPDTIDNVRKYISENGISSPVLFDCGQVTASYMKLTPKNPTMRFPHLFLLDKDGFIRNDFDHDEADNGTVSVKTLSAEIDKLLQGAIQKKR
ncbi:MAG: TlpA family protein disulfide reductase [Bryobacterales bacterium]|nr:TlpA family protein disulfide reductase [Bryobacterales bacterium]